MVKIGSQEMIGMKKTIVAFLAGIIFATTTSVFADDVINMIGRKVQAVNEITLKDGTRVGEGIIVDGKTYAPVRAISETAGFSVELEGKNVILNKEMVSQSNPAKPNLSLSDLNRNIEYEKKDIAYYKKTITQYESALNDPNFANIKASTQLTIDTSKARMQAAEERLAKYEAMKVELEAQLASLK